MRCFGIMMPDTIQYWSDTDGIAYISAQQQRQSLLPLHLSRWQRQVELELQLARQQSERQESVCGARNSLYFSPRISGVEFCFVSCPFQPPSILPTSSSGKESATYFFVSSDFVSQRTNNKTFRVSSLRMASRTHGCFSVLERNVAEEIASIVSTNRVSAFPPSV